MDPGSLQVSFIDASGNEVSSGSPDSFGSQSPGLFDFGAVPVGQSATMQLRVRNVGSGPLLLTSFSRPAVATPTLVTGTSIADPEPVFTLDFGEPRLLEAGAMTIIPVLFVPREADTSYRTRLTFTARNEASWQGQTQLTLLGGKLSADCRAPKTIDFLGVEPGTSSELTLELENPTDETRWAQVVLPYIEGQVFWLGPEVQAGSFPVPPHSTRSIPFVFTPPIEGFFSGEVSLSVSEYCPLTTVRLLGNGVSKRFWFEPESIDFGTIAVGTTSQRRLELLNFGRAPIPVDSLRFPAGAPFSLSASRLTIPPAHRVASDELIPGAAPLTVTFAPSTHIIATASLTGRTDEETRSTFAILVRGVGGGADLVVRPTGALNFGTLAATPGAAYTRTVTLQNGGSAAEPLLLGTPTATGEFGAPWWSVRALQGDLDELCVGMFDAASGTCTGTLPSSAYDPEQGLLPTSAPLRVPIRLAPTSTGPRAYEVTFFSSDFDRPAVVVQVIATVSALPDCALQLTPSALALSGLSPPTFRDFVVELKNLGTSQDQLCVVSNLEVTSTESALTLALADPSHATNTFQLPAQATLRVAVRAGASSTSLAPGQVGALRFSVSNATQPVRTVPISIVAGTPNCLVLTPSTLDFGNQRLGCSSATRSVQALNTCSTPLTLTGATVTNAEFVVVGGNAPGTSIPPGGSVTFALRYRPSALGPDQGSFTVAAQHTSGPLDGVVTLRGVGDTNGLKTDTVTLPSAPRKVDVLVVLDDSASMAAHQSRVKTNLQRFMSAAVLNGSDFHLSVTTTRTGAGVAGLARQTSAGTKVLTRSTANLTQQLDELLSGGTSGAQESCLDAASSFLTAPNIDDPMKNGGFLRADAKLTVLCVTDSVDHSTVAASTALTQLLAVKGAQRPWAFTFNAVAGFSSPPRCAIESPDDGRYSFMVSQTQGAKEDLCTADWGGVGATLGKASFGALVQVPLSGPPDLGATPLQVAVNASALPPVEANTNLRVWSYDSASNSVVFDALFAPSPGDVVTVRYALTCGP